MRNYEVTFIVDPTLSNDEIQSTAKKYSDLLKNAGKIVHIDEMGIRQLAYPIKRKNAGVYYCIEFEVEDGTIIPEMELQMRRDENLLRFLSVKLDKYGVQYNADKRDGKIAKAVKKKKEEPEDKDKDKGKKRKVNNPKKNTRKPEPKKETVVEAKVEEKKETIVDAKKVEERKETVVETKKVEERKETIVKEVIETEIITETITGSDPEFDRLIELEEGKLTEGDLPDSDV